MKLIIGIAGASGVIYGIRLLEALRELDQVESHLVMSNTGRMNIGLETDYDVKNVEALADAVHKNSNMAASIASGSFRADGMIVAACAMKTLSDIVHSRADTLLTRAADVTLKEQRRLVIMPRETPLHTGHCKLMYEASLLGAVIAPPMPAFYTNPQTIDDIINHSVGRVLDLFDLDTDLVTRWQGPTE
ncbi:UbiX family flavin prenyltransferase [Emcibacter nanhaiensis]|uniref:Flavin prenyltransferase UbiX n=1 Tax=Emcibacter nanhaiensis TaxID=1505037 RepID=A0A501PNU0_9PROT|nr:UbiX family flavin prenyltransferase [Emcibacter nanhaiensis]TPD61456.1 UbiX family flavin prenyltransferase [Emcibacter nanhaiensis]